MAQIVQAVGVDRLRVEQAGVDAAWDHGDLFASDAEVWGQTDYWASPLEMLAKGRGDCEDYVIGKSMVGPRKRMASRRFAGRIRPSSSLTGAT